MVYRDLLTSDLPQKQAAWPWLAAKRAEAHRRFQALGFPTRKLEAWKTISLDSLLGASYVSGEKKEAPKADAELFKNFGFAEEDARLVFLNGVYSEELSSINFLPHGVFLGKLSENIEFTPNIVEPYLATGLNHETNVFSLINTFSFKEGAFIYVPQHEELERQLHVFFVTTADENKTFAVYPRILIVLEDRAKADVTVNFLGQGEGDYFSDAHADIHLGAGASLNYSFVQRESKKGNAFVANRYFLKKESALNVLSFSQGGGMIRNENEVNFSGEHAAASLKGLSLLSGISQVFSHLLVNHAVPHCMSRQFYKNILADQSKSEFNSLVHVHRDAWKSDSNQLNRNLLLSDFAQSYSRPQLKIDNEDVSCTHGATVGQLEKDEFFYLRSRGLSKEQARFVLTYGFAEEILQEIKPEGLKKELELLVSEELKRVIQ